MIYVLFLFFSFFLCFLDSPDSPEQQLVPRAAKMGDLPRARVYHQRIYETGRVV